MRLFSNRSQRTSKCGKNISDTLGCATCATFLFLPHFDVICDLLLNRRTATWNLFVNYKVFWPLISDPFLKCVNESFEKDEMSQKQAVITLIEKKGKDRSYIENWRPISLVNVDTKIV